MSSEGPAVSSADSNWKTFYLDSDVWSAASSISMAVGERKAVAKGLPFSFLKDGLRDWEHGGKILFRHHPLSSVHQQGSVRTKVLGETKME